MIAGIDDAPGRIQHQRSLRIAFQLTQDFIQGRGLFCQILSFSFGVRLRIRPAHPSRHAINSSEPTFLQPWRELFLNPVVAADRGRAALRHTFAPKSFPCARHSDQRDPQWPRGVETMFKISHEFADRPDRLTIIISAPFVRTALEKLMSSFPRSLEKHPVTCTVKSRSQQAAKNVFVKSEEHTSELQS